MPFFQVIILPWLKAACISGINYPAIHYPDANEPFVVHKKLDNNLAILKIFPGIQPGSHGIDISDKRIAFSHP